jgi:hypothetical protein
MDCKIDLYRGPSLDYFGSFPLMPFARQSLEWLLGWDLSQTRIQLRALEVPEDTIAEGIPFVENLSPNLGYVHVRVFQGKTLIYQHPHPLGEVVTESLRNFLRTEYPEEMIWGFRIAMTSRFSQFLGSLPKRVSVEWSEELAEPQDPARFSVRRLPEPEPPVKSLTDFDLDADLEFQASPIKVILPQWLEKDLLTRRPLSRRVEEGGFLIGKVYRDTDREGSYLLAVADAPSAKFTGASFLHLTFTGDSFVEIKQSLKQSKSENRILGWFHTHLFPSRPDYGLSSVDVRLHLGTFTITWQVAALINLDGRNRTLRMYARRGNDVVPCPFRVTHERD